MLWWAQVGLRWPERDVALVRHPVGALDGSQAGGYSLLAGGDGLAVASVHWGGVWRAAS